MSHRDLKIRVAATKKLITLSYTDTQLSITNGRSVQVPMRQVIGARRDGRTLNLSYIARKKQAGPMSLTNLIGTVEDAEDDVLDAWIETLLHMAYEDTTRGGHAYDIAKEMKLDYDAIVVVSGDGLVHEIMNGFAHHAQPIKAFRIPLAPVPTGTGNGLSLNLLGIADGFDVSAAALNVVKEQYHFRAPQGLPMNVDVFSLTQNGKRTISFMSQAMGLMADLDIGTEHLRWMGEARFMYGLLRGMIQFKQCPVQLSYKAVESDKDKMVDALQERRMKDMDKGGAAPQLPANLEVDETALPPLRYTSTDDDGWTTLDKPLLYVFAGKGPYVGRDLMAFPVSLPDDGLIDIVAQPVSSRSEILLSLGGAPKGELYWNSSLKYIKAYAYRVKPLSPEGALAVDGEIFPFQEFQVEAHQGLATLLSPHGHYAAEPAPRPKRS
ncbi:ATP-NAD kinase-like domain-containing protein [Mycena latifolia]|nr:ATP-NAD kinase-like domain-containing protein [Mycena latifolia]